MLMVVIILPPLLLSLPHYREALSKAISLTRGHSLTGRAASSMSYSGYSGQANFSEGEAKSVSNGQAAFMSYRSSMAVLGPQAASLPSAFPRAHV